jgi:hypothetical protein
MPLVSRRWRPKLASRQAHLSNISTITITTIMVMVMVTAIAMVT